MPVLIDHCPMAVELMGFETVGQVLSHLARDNRLVVGLLIDGQEPERSELARIRTSPLGGLNLAIRTTEPWAMAAGFLSNLAETLDDAEHAGIASCRLLQDGRTSPAIQKLGQCLTLARNASEGTCRTWRLLRLDPSRTPLPGGNLAMLLTGIDQAIVRCRKAIETRTFDHLPSLIELSLLEPIGHWRDCLAGKQQTIEPRQAAA